MRDFDPQDEPTRTGADPHWRSREGIRHLFARYAWSFDTGDVDAYVATFAEDGMLDLPDGRYLGHAQIRAYAAGVVANPNFMGRQHFVGQSLFSPTQRGWTVRSYAMIRASTRREQMTRSLSTGPTRAAVCSR